MRQRRLSFLCLILASLSIPFSALGDEGDAAKKEESAKRLAALKKLIAGVEVTAGKERANKLERVEEPILRWSNPIVKIVDATVFVWTRDGRPVVVSQLADVTDLGVWHEYQSMTTEPIQAKRNGQTEWAPTVGGIEWKRAPTTEAPSGTPELRRVQMRKIAEKFQINDDFDFKPSQLRLLPTPLYRYSAPKLGVKDGALFTYVFGTDPEVMLLIEARKEGDAETWMVAFARLTGFACQATLDDKEFWSCKFPPESTFTQLRLGPSLSQ